MLFKALALFLILNSVFLETESQCSPPPNSNECVVIKDTQGFFLTVNDEREDKQRKLVLEKEFKNTRSTFRLELLKNINQLNLPVYRIVSCEKQGGLVSWSQNARLNLKGRNYYVFAGDLKGVTESSTWIFLTYLGSPYFQILDAKNGTFNMFSSSTADNDGDRFAAVHANEWPTGLSTLDDSKRFWTIESIPKSKGPGGSLALNAEIEATTEVFAFGVLPDKDDNEDQDETDSNEEQTTPEFDFEGDEVLAAESQGKPWVPESNSCYTIQEQFRGLLYSLAITSEKAGSTNWYRVKLVLDKKNPHKTWRFVREPKPESRHSVKYRIESCSNKQFLAISYTAKSSSKNEGRLHTADDSSSSNSWFELTELNGGKIEIVDAAMSFPLYSKSNIANPFEREVVSDSKNTVPTRFIIKK